MRHGGQLSATHRRDKRTEAAKRARPRHAPKLSVRRGRAQAEARDANCADA